MKIYKHMKKVYKHEKTGEFFKKRYDIMPEQKRVKFLNHFMYQRVMPYRIFKWTFWQPVGEPFLMTSKFLTRVK
jgi:hypothetical protein